MKVKIEAVGRTPDGTFSVRAIRLRMVSKVCIIELSIFVLPVFVYISCGCAVHDVKLDRHRVSQNHRRIIIRVPSLGLITVLFSPFHTSCSDLQSIESPVVISIARTDHEDYLERCGSVALCSARCRRKGRRHPIDWVGHMAL